VSEKSVAGLVGKVMLLGCLVGAGALLGTIAMAIAYSELVPPGPCFDVLPPSSAQCAFPKAPRWLLVLGAVSGAVLLVLPVHYGPGVIRYVRQSPPEA